MLRIKKLAYADIKTKKMNFRDNVYDLNNLMLLKYRWLYALHIVFIYLTFFLFI